MKSRKAHEKQDFAPESSIVDTSVNDCGIELTTTPPTN